MENMKGLVLLILASYFLLQSDGDPISLETVDEMKMMDRDGK